MVEGIHVAEEQKNDVFYRDFEGENVLFRHLPFHQNVHTESCPINVMDGEHDEGLIIGGCEEDGGEKEGDEGKTGEKVDD